MAENYTEMCHICLTTNRYNNISDSSCYTKFFIQVMPEVMPFKKFNKKLFLCMWCKAALKRALAVLTLALESEKARHDKITTNISSKPKSLYTLNYIHNSHIDIPPLKESQATKTENITKEMTNLICEIQDTNEIPVKRNKKELNSTEIINEESNEIAFEVEFENEIATKKRNKKDYNSTDIINEESNEIADFEVDFGNEKVTKRKNKKELDFNELQFEVEYLNFEEQLKDVELKKLKYKDCKFQCDECGMGFLTNDVFDEHNIRHSELSGAHKCSICALRFKSQDVLSQHTLAHKRRFKCLLCCSTFKRWSYCIAHRYKCGGVVQPIVCGECSKIFSNEYSLKIHMKVHKTEKKYCCGQCDRKFGSKQRLTVHLRSHSGIKPFACSHCARCFTTSSNLRAHSAVHEQTSQYYCVECHTYYKTAKSLKRHFNESAKHMTAKNDMYSCKECTKSFSTEKSLNYHINTRHGTEHRCTHCDKTFSNNSNLNKHIKCIHTAK